MRYVCGFWTNAIIFFGFFSPLNASPFRLYALGNRWSEGNPVTLCASATSRYRSASTLATRTPASSANATPTSS